MHNKIILTVTFIFFCALSNSTFSVFQPCLDLNRSQPKREYDESWTPNVTTSQQVTKINTSILVTFMHKIYSLFSESSDNPINTIIDFSMDKPVSFGQALEKYKFKKWGYSRGEHYKAAFQNDFDQVWRATNRPDLANEPRFISFPNIPNTVETASENDNIITNAAVFVANQVDKHEQATGHGPSSSLKDRSVAIPTEHGMYFCAKSCLYDYKELPNQEISCISQMGFDELSKYL